ncbi:DUF5366 family protein [Indiicoccus explosivorum]|uniref:DUF5366 family protein n=1 Tax=Indiicoccus explosivorum TaxID=1917864 RepID=UPI000B44F4DD|nr:DUF5366 family protein [Indiicoccus explosivorum]
MKNPYLYGYMPFITILLYSLTFGVFAVTETLELLKKVGLYTGMREFLSDIQLRLFLLIICSLAVFMLLAALKLMAETIHSLSLLFFMRDHETVQVNPGGAGLIIPFIGALISVAAVGSWSLLLASFFISLFIYFVFTVYRFSPALGAAGTAGVLLFEILAWSLFCALVIYAALRIYNGLVNSLPFLES